MTGDKLDKIIDEAIHFYDALHQESDRAAAILAASHFEDSLQEQIIGKFTNTNSELKKRSLVVMVRFPLSREKSILLLHLAYTMRKPTKGYILSRR